MEGSTMNWWTSGAKHTLEKHSGPNENSINVPFMSGCCIMLRVKAIEDLGLMNEQYFLYFEDADYSVAFQNKNWLISYIPSAEIIHTASRTTGFQSENYIYYFSRNKIWLPYK
jgi:GT2 family glycosyltransferase